VQFWYVRNSQGLRDSDWSHNTPAETFSTENDLDTKIGGEPKEDVLNRVAFSFRQGVLVPGAHVFNAFAVSSRRCTREGPQGLLRSRPSMTSASSPASGWSS
jgi:hypothetical protein